MNGPAKTAVDPCLACGGALKTVLDGVVDTRFGIAQPWQIAGCGRCGLVQTTPRPTQAELKALYEEHYNFGGEKNTAYTRLRERFLSSWAYRLLLTVDGDVSFHGKKGRGRLLDVGCNEGRSLPLYRRNGFAAEGIELNERAAAVARKRGFRVHAGTLADHSAGEGYDAIVLSNVIEHVPAPVETLADIRSLLNENGEVWISCPNLNSWQRSLFGRKWINWHPPFHLTHFTADSLTRLLGESGFQVRKTTNVSPAMWLVHSLLSRLFARPGRPIPGTRNPLIVGPLMLLARCTLFPLLWAGNRIGRGDCLVVVARKA